MKKLLKLLLVLGSVAGTLWMLRDKLMPPQQPPLSHPPSFRSPPSPTAERPTITPDSTADDLTVVKGIGPVYSERLTGIGITSFSELAHADAASVAEQLEIGEAEVTNWVTQASELT